MTNTTEYRITLSEDDWRLLNRALRLSLEGWQISSGILERRGLIDKNEAADAAIENILHMVCAAEAA